MVRGEKKEQESVKRDQIRKVKVGDLVQDKLTQSENPARAHRVTTPVSPRYGSLMGETYSGGENYVKKVYLLL